MFPELTESVAVGPDVDVESWRLTVPGRAGCFLLQSEAREPLLLATMANVRAALVHRLRDDDEGDEVTPRKMDYRAVVRAVRWRDVFSRFEGNWVYLENARRCFPSSYRKLIRRWRAAWVCIDMADEHPRWVVADRPVGDLATCFGPIAEQRAARRYVEMLEDLFDLCRYHHVLVQAPRGEACAYKEMDKCPAPCDGTVSMNHYRKQLDASIDFVRGGVESWRQATRDKMQAASAALNFEAANRHKSALQRSEAADHPALRNLEPVGQFKWLVVEPGSRKGRVRVFCVAGGVIEPLGEVQPKERVDRAAAIAAHMGRVCEQPIGVIDAAGAERMGLVAQHLLDDVRGPGAFVRGEDAMDAGRIVRAMEDVAEHRRRSFVTDLSSE